MPQAEVHIDGVTFHTGLFAQPTESGHFALQKRAAMIEHLAHVLDGFDRPRIVEVGIYLGGSVALLSLLADPSRLVSLELSPDRVERLDQFIDERGLGERVRPYYGVDQADRSTVARIVDDELHGEPLDLVIDDASHLYEPTLATFEVLFPRLKPGGLYLIEDWCRHEKHALALQRVLDDPTSPYHETMIDALAADHDEPIVPLSRLATELVMLRAEGGTIVDHVSVDEHWVEARRGPGPVDPKSFRLHDALVDPFDALPVHPPPKRQP